jgi:hypothetical protein
MRTRVFLASGALFLSLVAIGSAKSWDIVVSSTTKAGSVMLPAGSYSVKLNNNQAFFKEANSGKTYSVPVKVENADHKYSDTSVQTSKQGPTQVMESIDLGGTTEKLEFGE